MQTKLASSKEWTSIVFHFSAPEQVKRESAFKHVQSALPSIFVQLPVPTHLFTGEGNPEGEALLEKADTQAAILTPS